MISESYLKHHGIEGQKWGIQNGPPYPLSKAAINNMRNNTIYSNELSKYSSSDLKYLTERLELEQRYEALSSVDVKKQIRERQVRKAINKIGAGAAIISGATGIAGLFIKNEAVSTAMKVGSAIGSIISGTILTANKIEGGNKK